MVVSYDYVLSSWVKAWWSIESTVSAGRVQYLRWFLGDKESEISSFGLM